MNVYLDNAATTKIKDEVYNEMIKYLKDEFGNPSSIYDIGKNSKGAIEDARGHVASLINADPSEIFFTGSGTEADNWALKGIVDKNYGKPIHIITTKIEHHAVLDTCRYLSKRGVSVTYLAVDENGKIYLDELENSIRPETKLISIMFANNEIGTIQDIESIGKIAKKHNVPFHTDAIQAAGNIDIDVSKMNIDMLSLSAHKLHGPKGVGALYIRKGVRIDPFIHGGGQESGKRASTENVAGIVGFGVAAKLTKEDSSSREKIKYLRDKLITKLLEIPDTKLNGHREDRLVNNVNISFKKIEGESILMLLNHVGISASSGSACTSGSLDPSHVLLAIGLTHEVAHGSIRFTLDQYTTEEEIDYLTTEMPKIVSRLREMSPIK